MSGDIVFVTPATGAFVVTWDRDCGIWREPIIAWRHIICPHDQSVTTWPITVEGSIGIPDGEFAIHTPGCGATHPYVIPHQASFETLGDLVDYWLAGHA